ncbi:unnamed protein product [Gongylonema pulchrum]|uniref:Autophagy-related protein 101 n=1 Tax=Gongylonema pulchrum TaxID=637853 RepID=A0A183DA19_9BILA|nr:unnamed protein product [Gongylonema pulchrum]
MLIHVHAFNTLPDFYCLPHESLKEKPLLRYILKGNKPALSIGTRELEMCCSQNVAAANFVDYWRIISEFEERLWQKWSYVYTFRIVLAHDHPLPTGLFLAEESAAKLSSQFALTALHNVLLQMATFPLVHEQCYVRFVDG